MTLHQIVGREPSRTGDKETHAKLNIRNPSIEETRTNEYRNKKSFNGLGVIENQGYGIGLW